MSISKLGVCSGCSNSRIIVNKKHNLCNLCNRDRLGTKTKKSPLKRTKALQRKRPRSISKKQLSIKQRLGEIYQQMGIERDRICTGCGTTQNLSHSHLIPRSRRSDLTTDINNITYHCISFLEKEGCHQKWESGDFNKMSSLNDFDQIMSYIEKVDIEYYNLIMSKDE